MKIFLVRRVFSLTLISLSLMKTFAQPGEVKLNLDGEKRFQKLDGFGVNINCAWWFDGKYGDGKVVRPAIDMLVDSLGATIFRAVIEEIDWETVNDDNDPDHFNWTYYKKVFSNEKFRGVWNTLRYINKKGITDGLIFSFMGAPPSAAPGSPADPQKSWMGGTDYSINPSKEDELVESLAALLYYARHYAGVKFSLVSPMNETDVIAWSKNARHPDGIVEGPNIPDAVQYTRIVRKLAEKLDATGMSDVRFVAPDASNEELFNRCLEEFIRDPYLTGKIAHWGVHQYGNSSANYQKSVNNPANPNKSFWVTETAGIDNMMGQLKDGAGAYIFWDGFDCVYQHGIRNGYGRIPPNDWVFWEGNEGKPLIEYLAATNNWKPRKQFYQFYELFRFVKPGAVFIDAVSRDTSLIINAFLNPDRQLVITGYNKSNSRTVLDATFANLPGFKRYKLIYTDDMVDCMETEGIISDDPMQFNLPANSVYTIILYQGLF